MYNKGEMSGGQQFALAVLVIAVGALIANQSGLLSTPSPSPEDEPSEGAEKQISATQELSYDVREAFEEGTSISSPTVKLYSLPGFSKVSDETGTNVPLSSGSDYVALVSKNGYITEKDPADSESFTVPGDDFVESPRQVLLEPRATFSEVVTFRNDDGSENGASNREAVEQGVTEDVTMELQAPSKETFQDGVLVVEVNDTAYSDVTISDTATAETPETYTTSTVGAQTYSFDIEGLSDGETREQTVSFEAENGVNPGEAAVPVTHYEKAFGTDSLTGEVIGPVVEDSDNQLVGPSGVTEEIYLG